MTSFPRSPRVTKGALVSFDRKNPIAKVIVFQYNPEKMTRSLKSKESTGEGDREEVLRIKGAPSETISMKIEIDATDQLETADPVAVALGIYPQLSALELLLYPTSTHVKSKTIQALAGTLEIAPPESPLTILAMGRSRVVPVRLTSLTINETAFDPNLNPIQADVDLSLDVLTYDDFPVQSVGYSLFLAHQVAKEAMAALGTVKSLGAIAGGSVKIF
jgi:Contractile injection system tube protein